MVSSKRLAQMAEKWQSVAGMGRKRLTRTTTARAANECCATSPSSSVAVKGHCVVYTADGARFEVPLAYLGTAIIGELLSMSHDEFGFASDGRITLPCDAAVMKYVLCLLRRNASEEVERALLSSVVRTCHQDRSTEVSMGVRSAVSSF
ncbi:auxin-responsive protein SAUR36-like [Lolium rigidum]|uniref:auxin-responsive protein SAUR36-like n=1 Tax=Lolium rigidum TaxID=89674 RepID=UPI001F5D1F48|nr:auxin-responsive protein SAUR36-like [Lolium rigidum]XP_047052029.1 auxin-responsive protein SAUR36-like [Lolium rigidum]